MHTTLNEILSHHPCGKSEGSTDGLAKLLKHLSKTSCDDEQLTYATILKSNGIEDAIWALRCRPDDKLVRKFACDCSEGALKFYEAKYPDDKRPRDCIKAARDFIDGKITREELNKVRRAADAAYATATYATYPSYAAAAYAATAAAAHAAYAATAAAAYAAYAATAAYAAYAAAAYAAADAAYTAYTAAYAAADAAYATAAYTARKKQREEQAALYRKYFC